MATKAAPRSSLEHQAPHATLRIEGTIPVRAKRRGFYDNHIKEPGDVFSIRAEDKLGSWMELVNVDAQQSGKAEDGGASTAEGAEKTEGAKPKADKKGGAKKSGKAEDDVL